MKSSSSELGQTVRSEPSRRLSKIALFLFAVFNLKSLTCVPKTLLLSCFREVKRKICEMISWIVLSFLRWLRWHVKAQSSVGCGY